MTGWLTGTTRSWIPRLIATRCSAPTSVQARALAWTSGVGPAGDLSVIAEHGCSLIGVELSADQLRLAAGRGGCLVRGDAEHLPFRDSAFAMAVSSWTSTDVDHFDWMLTETARVLEPNGQFLFYGVHRCFNGPHVESGPDRSRGIVHTTYRAAERHSTSPWWGEDGIRVKAGGMRHLPLADFINAFIDAGLRIERLHEPDEEPVPYALVVKAALRS